RPGPRGRGGAPPPEPRGAGPLARRLRPRSGPAAAGARAPEPRSPGRRDAAGGCRSRGGGRGAGREAAAAPVTAPAQLETFVQRRDERWRALETLLDAAEREAELGPQRLMELVRLYRLSCSDLNRLRTLTANPDLLGRVNRIVARGYRTIYQHRMRRWPRLEGKRWLGRDMPDTVRREGRFVLASAVATLLRAALGFPAGGVHPGPRARPARAPRSV